MVKQAAAARTTDVDLDPIDRLEEKVKRLVELISQLRAEQTRAADDNARLMQEIDTLRARVADGERAGTELVALRDERDMIRTRVAEMLEQLEAI
jgi:regulator of replication initiation timing